MTSHMGLPPATPKCDSYGRTDGRTNEESWLSTRDHPCFRNARAHIRKFPLDPEPTDLSATRARADKDAVK